MAGIEVRTLLPGGGRHQPLYVVHHRQDVGGELHTLEITGDAEADPCVVNMLRRRFTLASLTSRRRSRPTRGCPRSSQDLAALGHTRTREPAKLVIPVPDRMAPTL